MKLALIPPTDLLYYTSDTTYQLCLPQMILNDERYFETYEGWCASDSDFVILDNGAAEGPLFDSDALVQMAINMEVDELVIPDVMKEYEANRALCIDFCARYASLLKSQGIRLMFVVQGTTESEIKDAIIFASSYQDIDTIGLPRHLIQTLGWDRARYENAHYANKMTDKPIHLLGGSPVLPDEIKRFDWPDNVRGTDTSSPFNFAFKGQTLTTTMQVHRPEDYFNLTRDDFNIHIVEDNVNMLKDWCE